MYPRTVIIPAGVALFCAVHATSSTSFSAKASVFISNDTPLTLRLAPAVHQAFRIHKKGRPQAKKRPLSGKHYRVLAQKIEPFQRGHVMDLFTGIPTKHVYQYAIEVRPFLNGKQVGAPITLLQQMYKHWRAKVGLVGEYAENQLRETGWTCKDVTWPDTTRTVSVHSSLVKPTPLHYPDIDYGFTMSQLAPQEWDRNPNRLHVLQYNIFVLQKGLDLGRLQGKFRAERIPFLIPRLTKPYRPDVVTINEAFDFHEPLRRHMKENGYGFSTRVYGALDVRGVDGKRVVGIKPFGIVLGVKPNGGVQIFSHYAIVEEDGITYRAAKGRERGVPKGAAYAKIRKEGRIYHVFATHVQSDVDGKIGDNPAVRGEQFEELGRFILKKITGGSIRSEVKKERGSERRVLLEPVIISGDLNVPRDRREPLVALGDRRVTEYEAMVERLKADDVRAEGYPFSSDHDPGHKKLLDYMLLYHGRSDVWGHPRPVKAFTKVLHGTRFKKPWVSAGKYWRLRFRPSDHHPLYGYFEFGAVAP